MPAFEMYPESCEGNIGKSTVRLSQACLAKHCFRTTQCFSFHQWDLLGFYNLCSWEQREWQSYETACALNDVIAIVNLSRMAETHNIFLKYEALPIIYTYEQFLLKATIF